MSKRNVMKKRTLIYFVKHHGVFHKFNSGQLPTFKSQLKWQEKLFFCISSACPQCRFLGVAIRLSWLHLNKKFHLDVNMTSVKYFVCSEIGLLYWFYFYKNVLVIHKVSGEKFNL